jgi:regulator of sirC expression with transglutaminase-like and TPR domain
MATNVERFTKAVDDILSLSPEEAQEIRDRYPISKTDKVRAHARKIKKGIKKAARRKASG